MSGLCFVCALVVFLYLCVWCWLVSWCIALTCDLLITSHLPKLLEFLRYNILQAANFPLQPVQICNLERKVLALTMVVSATPPHWITSIAQQKYKSKRTREKRRRRQKRVLVCFNLSEVYPFYGNTFQHKRTQLSGYSVIEIPSIMIKYHNMYA